MEILCSDSPISTLTISPPEIRPTRLIKSLINGRERPSTLPALHFVLKAKHLVAAVDFFAHDEQSPQSGASKVVVEHPRSSRSTSMVSSGDIKRPAESW
jgi:hypothetical protein